MTRAESFSDREVAMCQVARLVEDGRTYWAAGGGTPLYSVLLGQKLYAPDAQYITEDGVIAPEPLLPFEPMMTMVASRAVHRALAWGTMNSAGTHAQLGYMDYGVLNTLQVDQHGNINSTWLGEYGASGRRFGGPGGADTIAACCWRTILITDQERRKFVRQVDFISSPGFLDGTPGARERAGLPRDTGPWRVVTPWAMYGMLGKNSLTNYNVNNNWTTTDGNPPFTLRPYPFASKDHQTADARAVEKKKAADVVDEKDMTCEFLVDYLTRIFSSPDRLAAMSQAARKRYSGRGAEALADLVEQTAAGGRETN